MHGVLCVDNMQDTWQILMKNVQIYVLMESIMAAIQPFELDQPQNLITSSRYISP